MTGSRKHVAPDRYSKAEVATRGLACPFANSDRDAYMSIDVCKPTEGFKEARLLLYVQPKPTQKGTGPPYITAQLADIGFAVSIYGGSILGSTTAVSAPLAGVSLRLEKKSVRRKTSTGRAATENFAASFTSTKPTKATTTFWIGSSRSSSRRSSRLGMSGLS